MGRISKTPEAARDQEAARVAAAAYGIFMRRRPGGDGPGLASGGGPDPVAWTPGNVRTRVVRLNGTGHVVQEAWINGDPDNVDLAVAKGFTVA